MKQSEHEREHECAGRARTHSRHLQHISTLNLCNNGSFLMKLNESLTRLPLCMHSCKIGKFFVYLGSFHAWLASALFHLISIARFYSAYLICCGVYQHFHLFMSVRLSPSSVILPPKTYIYANNWTDDECA